MQDSVQQIPVTFNSVKLYPLTTSYVASDAFDIPKGKYATLHAYYTPGAGGTGNTVSFQLEGNSYLAAAPQPGDTPYVLRDSSNAHFSPVGVYNDVSGVYTQEIATFTSPAGTASTQANLVPVELTNIAATQMRIKAKETIVGGSAGTVQFVVMLNTIN